MLDIKHGAEVEITSSTQSIGNEYVHRDGRVWPSEREYYGAEPVNSDGTLHERLRLLMSSCERLRFVSWGQSA